MEPKYVILNPDETETLIKEMRLMREAIEKKNDTYPLKDRWLTVKQAREVLSISSRKLQSLRTESKNKIPYSRIDGLCYFKASDIQKYLEDHYNGNNKLK
jgi:DNA-binding Xre family transcriptional regulator